MGSKPDDEGCVMASDMTLRVPGELLFTDEQRQMIRDAYASGCSDGEFAVLMEIAKARRLNPLLKQIHFVSRYDSQKGRSVWACQVSIDGLRAIAERTGLYHGQDEPEFVESDGRVVCAKVRVWRRDWPRPAVGVAYWDEYVQTTRDKQTGKQTPTSFWQRMPHTMLAKCAESLALRKAFPEDMSGLYTPEEMGQAENDARDEYGPHAEQPAREPHVIQCVRDDLASVVSLDSAAAVYAHHKAALDACGPDSGVHAKAKSLLVAHLENQGAKGVKSKLDAAVRALLAPKPELPAPTAPSPVLLPDERPLAEAVQAAAQDFPAALGAVVANDPEPTPEEKTIFAYQSAIDVSKSAEDVLAARLKYRALLPQDEKQRKELWTYALQAITTHSGITLAKANTWLIDRIKAHDNPTPPDNGPKGRARKTKDAERESDPERAAIQAESSAAPMAIVREIDDAQVDEAAQRNFLAQCDGPAWQRWLKTRTQDFHVMGSYYKRRSDFVRRGLDADRRESVVWELASRARDATEAGLAKAAAALDTWMSQQGSALVKRAS